MLSTKNIHDADTFCVYRHKIHPFAFTGKGVKEEEVNRIYRRLLSQVGAKHDSGGAFLNIANDNYTKDMEKQGIRKSKT